LPMVGTKNRYLPADRTRDSTILKDDLEIVHLSHVRSGLERKYKK